MLIGELGGALEWRDNPAEERWNDDDRRNVGGARSYATAARNDDNIVKCER